MFRHGSRSADGAKGGCGDIRGDVLGVQMRASPERVAEGSNPAYIVRIGGNSFALSASLA